MRLDGTAAADGVLTSDPAHTDADGLRDVLRYLTAVERMDLFALVEGRAERQKTFREYIEIVNPRFQFTWHNEILIYRLQDVADELLYRLIVNEPPRHGKSEIISRLFSSYYLYRHPDRFGALIGFGDTLPRGHSRAARRYFQRAGGVVADDIAAVGHWETPEGGGIYSAGTGGGIMGKGFHLGIIDDPYKSEKEAQSETIRASVESFYDSTFYTRQAPGAAIIILVTRWHESDLVAWLLRSEAAAEDTPEGWHVISFDAIHEVDSFNEWRKTVPATVTVERDPRQDGEALWPERWPVEKLRRIRRRMGGPNGYRWRCLYQQRPAPREGGFFAVNLITRVHVSKVPPLLRIGRGWDKAATQGCGSWTEVGPENPPIQDADWTTGIRIGYDAEGNYYITGYMSGQWSPGNRDTEIRRTVIADGVNVMHRSEREPGAAGVSDERWFRRLCTGFRCSFENSSNAGAKETRAGPFASAVEGGRVFIVEGDVGSRPDAGAPQSWTDRLLNNLRRTDFKSGHDDDADACSIVFNWLSIFELRETEEAEAARTGRQTGEEGSRVVSEY